ncbi:Uncharacterised protein [Bordetella pertussis]|nr:Uncharacterised protein [Bordetella pertussis]CFD92954.1 Uncharacterised protein [Bordetella pertussis]CFE03517.1 Uncharacterised protein [Bordetella pertussis]CFL81995.1 Uncharacterised protein [Bordetella pertussis]CFL91459.1 Uncharacterised protein [Bordetella pertussis]
MPLMAGERRHQYRGSCPPGSVSPLASGIGRPE